MNGASTQLKRVLTLYLLGFLLIFGYSLARPCIDSMFLEHYPSDALPTAWLYTAVISVAVIMTYNRYNQRLAILPLFGIISFISAVSLSALLALYFWGFTPAIFILYIWKEIYMVVLMETYWSYADIVFSISTARMAYGLAMAVSSFGGVVGNLAVGPLAKNFGTKETLCGLIFLLMVGGAISYFARSLADEKPKLKGAPAFALGIKTLMNSKYLVPMALLVCTGQMVIGLIDYNFNSLLAENYVNTDLRTEVLGQIHAAVNVFGIVIQFCTGLILRVFGIANTFQSVPFILGTLIFAFVLLPKFALMLMVKISSKTLDYSLMRGVKEILYIPLSREEKTQGKGFIDIFIYRLAKGFSSVTLLALIAVGASAYVMEFSLVLMLIWLGLAIIIGRRYQSLVSSENK